MRRYRIDVTQTLHVTLDEAKFDAKFLKEFRNEFYNFATIEEHAMHIAQLQSRGIIDCEITPDFIEGYGPSDSFGITAKVLEIEISDAERLS